MAEPTLKLVDISPEAQLAASLEKALKNPPNDMVRGMLIHVSRDGSISWRTLGNFHSVELVGVLEWVKLRVFQDETQGKPSVFIPDKKE